MAGFSSRTSTLLRRRGFNIALFTLPLLMGCADAQFRLAPDSPIPNRWRNDPRTHGWKSFYIVYTCYAPDTVVASVCPHRCEGFWTRGDCPDCFKTVGKAHRELQQYPGGPPVVSITFDGIEETYEVRDPYPDEPGRVYYLISHK